VLSIRTPSYLLALASLTTLIGCAKIVSGVDGEALGYGPPDATLAGYDEDPVPRPRVSAWTPPTREPAATLSLGDMMAEAEAEPIAYIAEVRELCEQLRELGSEEAPAACLRRHRIARLFRTMDKWKGMVACVGAAGDLDGATACETANPPAFATGEDYPRETETCLHVLALTIIENAGAEPMMSADELRGLAPVMHDCVDSLVNEEREQRGPKAYFEMLDCIDAALSTTEAEACEA